MGSKSYSDAKLQDIKAAARAHHKRLGAQGLATLAATSSLSSLSVSLSSSPSASLSAAGVAGGVEGTSSLSARLSDSQYVLDEGREDEEAAQGSEGPQLDQQDADYQSLVACESVDWKCTVAALGRSCVLLSLSYCLVFVASRSGA